MIDGGSKMPKVEKTDGIENWLELNKLPKYDDTSDEAAQITFNQAVEFIVTFWT